MKKCKKCSKEKDEALFTKDVRNKDGLQTNCNECRSEEKRIKRLERSKYAIVVSEKKCNKCGSNKSSGDFYKDNGFSDGLSSTCKTCKDASTAIWREANRESNNAYYREYRRTEKRTHKNIDLKRTHGITLEHYESMLKEQDNKCSICTKEITAKTRPMAVDHCHSSGEVRALLCYNCNRGMHFIDNEELLQKMIAYRDSHKVK